MKTQHDDCQIGDTVLVECVRTVPKSVDTRGLHELIWIPVLPYKAHTDEDLGFEPAHFHYDFRFWSNRLVDVFFEQYDRKTQNWGSYVCLESDVKHRRTSPMICLRETPILSEAYSFQAILEEKYKNCKLVNGICPHKGFNVVSIGDDKTYCPGHGLHFDRNGNVIQRY
ncbi:MAG: hypothetical protein EAZ73_09015 [Oscillatoriales cyanobacterium]|uniref:Rieske 2Fe-2S domain-containing protein n=1 Tax=unclassified Microcoleus TaxID=2642155 RepID=UPI001D6ECB55|nr:MULTISPECIES: Rieske 2Fe-2S domain-containing protein [unclassified Microcoleus]TAF00882.1 MAG: hypothetical protein EAZ79_01585 [Oscillatoriales cyanobacterium]MCC3459777.1 Rieske 2Fe-2S domain-containing protein [Microcoleus sp. PH2017_11_PCY_U_A]MCC3478210.1 Rieske 2Fe-2S domain-containing protein [Microcoleus sp. PH2017_12_PCY_D_A]TAF21360.1 MAG: hypothetical protein EAZ73_09015 [Oscillatoriales cyanobacterium]TAF39713.1 MAG: hypothetical protein EAZ69_00330 [Oscillatoriales cyanobacter